MDLLRRQRSASEDNLASLLALPNNARLTAARLRTINELTNHSWGELRYAMFRSGYQPGFQAAAGIFYGGRMPMRQVVNDVSMINMALRVANLRSVGVDLSMRLMSDAMVEAEHLFLSQNRSGRRAEDERHIPDDTPTLS